MVFCGLVRVLVGIKFCLWEVFYKVLIWSFWGVFVVFFFLGLRLEI